MTVEIWHNILWPRYKARIFSALYAQAVVAGRQIRFIHMAETERARITLGPINRTEHRYPYELLYSGPIEAVPRWRSVPRFFWRALTSRAAFVVVAGYAAPQDWAQLAGLMLRGIPRGVFCDSTLNEAKPGRLRGWAKRFFLRRCALVFCYGERSMAMARAFGARPEALIGDCQAAALPHGYDIAAIPARRAARRSPTPCFLYVGRLAPEKNVARLLDAFALFAPGRPDARLRLAGHGPLRAELQAHAAALGIAEAVAFLGGLDPDTLADEYLAATALVLPSLREPWGLVVNEALAHGCPVLVSDRCGCVPELVRPESGLVFHPLDPAALHAGLVAIATAPPDPAGCLRLVAPFTPEAAAARMAQALWPDVHREPSAPSSSPAKAGAPLERSL